MKLTTKQLNDLNNQFKAIRYITDEYIRAPESWIKQVRITLGISGRQMANRMGVSPSRITQIEKAETDDRVSIKSLRQAADALECNLFYAIVPRKIKDNK